MSRRRSPQGDRTGSRGASRAAAGGLGLGLLLLAAGIGAGLGGCNDRNRGISPDGAGLYFPAGTVLDPRVAEGTPARWMFVLNANSDLVYNAGTLVPVDIERFFKEWMRDPEACFRRKDVDGDGIAETEDGDAEACQPGRPPGKVTKDAGKPWTSWPEVGDVGAVPSAGVPCRRNALKPQVVECGKTAQNFTKIFAGLVSNRVTREIDRAEAMRFCCNDGRKESDSPFRADFTL